jgi:hypothetical protein
MGRPALTEEQVRDKVLAYCERYHVSPGPEGLPPFPSGKRETRQHREWLTVYRALQRLKARSSGAVDSRGLCALCARAARADESVSARLPGRRALSGLHPGCAELLRLAAEAGPVALSRLSGLLSPRRAADGS